MADPSSSSLLPPVKELKSLVIGDESKELAVQLALQFMYERGLLSSFEELQKESGLLYKPQEVIEGGLLTISKRHLQQHKQDKQNEERRKLRALCVSDDEVAAEVSTLSASRIRSGHHSVNILSAKFSPTLPKVIASSSVNGTICLDDCDGGLGTTVYESRGGILCLAWHPSVRLLLAGFMDGSHVLLEVNEELEMKEIQGFNDHEKYVNRVIWISSGNAYLTCSYDTTVNLYQKRENSYHHTKKYYLDRIPDAIALVPGKDVVVIGKRESYLLTVLTFEGDTITRSEVNVNENKDNYCSFSALDIQFNNGGDFISLYSDKNRIFVYSWPSMKRLSTIEGVRNSQNCTTCRHVWSHTDQCILATSELDCRVYGFNVYTEKAVKIIEGGSKIRNIDINRQGQFLTCSYDKTVKIYDV